MKATERYRQAAETGDVDLAMTTFAPDAVLHSPLTGQVSFTGHAELRPLIEVAYSHLKNVHFHTDLGDDETRVVIYTAELGDEPIEEAALLRLANDRIIEATLYARPLPGLVTVMSVFGPDLARRNNRPAAARFLALATKPLRAMVRSGDKHAVPLAAPR